MVLVTCNQLVGACKMVEGQVLVVYVNSPTTVALGRIGISARMQVCAHQPVALANARNAPAASSKALAPKSIP